MTKLLSESACIQYQERGYYHPIPVLSSAEAKDYRRRLEDYEARTGGPIGGVYRHKSHLLFTWLNDLIRHPAILDAVEDILGPNLLCWSSSFFIKEAHDPSYVSWHQDSTYWGLSRPDVTTAWIGFTDSNLSNGCMEVIPGTHGEQVEHHDTYAKNNLLSRGQEIAVKVDEARAIPIELKAGQMSLHHVRLFHSSPQNPSNDRRIGYAIRYIPTDVYQVKGPKDFATLVRGVDRHGHYEHEQSPKQDLDADALAYHKRVCDFQGQILYAGAPIKPFTKNAEA
ncbi:MAG: phytanoyl-CoA dioxygenase family protein [Gammaproteobacteria bacterium]